jgi:hypothetical protein
MSDTNEYKSLINLLQTNISLEKRKRILETLLDMTNRELAENQAFSPKQYCRSPKSNAPNTDLDSQLDDIKSLYDTIMKEKEDRHKKRQAAIEKVNKK